MYEQNVGVNILYYDGYNAVRRGIAVYDNEACRDSFVE